MYGLIKIANEQKENSALSTAGNAALAAGGAGAIAASHDRLLGRRRVFHGVTDAEAAAIRQDPNGLRFVSLDREEKPNPLSSSKSEARHQANMKGDPILSTNKRVGDELLDSYHKINDESLDLYSKTKDRYIENNPDLSRGKATEMAFKDPDMAKMDELDEVASKLRYYSNVYEDSAKRRYQQLMDNPSLVAKSGDVLQYSVPYTANTRNIENNNFFRIDASDIIGGDHDIGHFGRLKESLRRMPEYIKLHPGRFGAGAAMAGTGLAGMGLAAHNQFNRD